MENKKLLGRKNAGVTVEVSLSIVLTIAVIFLAIGLLNGSLYTIADNVGLKNLTHRDKVTDDWGTTSTERTQINVAQSQQEVQVVAEQGLEWYLSEAQATIDKYKKNPPATPAEFEDLARAELILKIGDSSGSKLSVEDQIYCKSLGLKVSLSDYTYKVTVNDSNVYSVSIAEVSDAECFEAIKGIAQG